ncbi:unnamed protein product [Mycena citricolor]|uniref:F-box domain-containing protein n=1 Tax=Mycena citricolor TaxID=2018698 RepID=A0AAD2HVY3_9AGAR|nr:unnamed protein product [Mycena citricolor]
MAPSRYSKLKRKVSLPDDVLIHLLKYLDPRSLFVVSKMFRRFRRLTMDFHLPRYKYELARSGMKDGRVALSMAPIVTRLHLLANHQKEWSHLTWTHEYKLQVATPSHSGVSGGILYQIRPHGTYSTLEIAELPSARLGRSPAETRRLRMTTPPIETVCIDPTQALIIGAHIFHQGGIVGIQLHFRDLWSFGQHPRASAESYQLPTQNTMPVARTAISVHGSKLVVTLHFVNGQINHLLMDWRNLGARWIDDLGARLLDDDLLLVLCKKGGHAPVLNLCDISDIATMSVIRQFELPPMWAHLMIEFCSNDSLYRPTPGALFQSDPVNRLLALAAKPVQSVSGNSQSSWMFVNENYFRDAPMRRDYPLVPWTNWSQFVTVKDLSQHQGQLGRPFLVGSRVVYLEYMRPTTYLKIIEFAPFPDASVRPDPSWVVMGLKSGLIPSEAKRRLSSSTTEHYGVDDISISDDNVVLFLELQPGYRPINVLTFGAPPA